MGLKLATSDFRLLLRWWLGLHLTDEPVATTCHLCGGFVDPFVDHYLCCPRRGFYNRHQTVVAHLSHVAKAAGLRVSFEESIPEGIRLADMLISSWPTTGTSLAIDVSVVHPLGLSHLPHLIARSAVTPTLSKPRGLKRTPTQFPAEILDGSLLLSFLARLG